MRWDKNSENNQTLLNVVEDVFKVVAVICFAALMVSRCGGYV
jgi:hypothetical protein